MNTKQHQVANQNFTLLTAIAARNEWTIAEVNKLKDMKAAGMSVKDIAVELGRTYYSINTYISVMGLGKPRRNSKPQQKIEACSICYLVHSYECER
jgi:hypothetical protein